jgi:pimeloyl-ACP methyl ester carboxylesterase
MLRSTPEEYRNEMSVATSADGVPISYEMLGTGMPALVFVHGWSCDRRYWKRQVEHFARTYQVVAIDLAGHGESGFGRQNWTMPAFGKDVVAVLERIRTKEVVLIGHSMGGDVVVEAARLMPASRVRGLVWVDAYNTLGKPRTEEEVKEFMTPFRVDFVEATRKFVRKMFVPSSKQAIVDWVVSDMSAAPPEVAFQVLEKVMTFDREIVAGLRELKAPLIAVNSDRRPTDVGALQRYGVKKVVLISGVGHFPMMEASDRFNRLLTNIIDGFPEPAVV